MSTLSTHVLDAALGVPADTLATTLHDAAGSQLAAALTDTDGRIAFDVELGAGVHRLVFDTGAYFAAADRDHFHPEVTVAFEVGPSQDHHHVALLLAPFSYTTYRGS